MMIRIIESIDTNSLEPNIQKVVDEILIPLDDHVIINYVDETLMPDEISIEVSWEYEPGNEEYIGTWEIDMNQSSIKNYSNYLTNISDEISAAYAFITDANLTESTELRADGGDETFKMFYLQSNNSPSIKEIEEYAKSIGMNNIYWGSDEAPNYKFKGFYNGDCLVIYDDANKLPDGYKEDALKYGKPIK